MNRRDFLKSLILGSAGVVALSNPIVAQAVKVFEEDTTQDIYLTFVDGKYQYLPYRLAKGFNVKWKFDVNDKLFSIKGQKGWKDRFGKQTKSTPYRYGLYVGNIDNDECYVYYDRCSSSQKMHFWVRIERMKHPKYIGYSDYKDDNIEHPLYSYLPKESDIEGFAWKTANLWFRKEIELNKGEELTYYQPYKFRNKDYSLKGIWVKEKWLKKSPERC